VLKPNLILLIAGLVLIAQPTYGYFIRSVPDLQYQKGSISPPASEIEIQKVYGFEITPTSLALHGQPEETVVFCHSFENLSNCTARIDFDVKSAPAGSEVKIMVGTSESFEYLLVPESSVFPFWVLFTPPENSIENKNYTLKLTVSSSKKDGPTYTGFDGKLHGGRDEITITDTVLL